MDKQTGPKGFLVVLPGEIIEIPQDSDKSWLTLFYSLPRELAEKWKPAYELPRCPYEVLRTDKYDRVVCDDMFKLLVWDCYAWCAWQFFQVKDRKGNYRDIPGNWNQYAGYFPLWRLSYSIIPYIRMKFEQNGLGFQNLYNIPQGVEVPWLTYQQFSNLVGNVTDMVIAEQNWQPMIDAIWENRTVEDYETTSSTVKTDFMRKWHHNRSGKPIPTTAHHVLVDIYGRIPLILDGGSCDVGVESTVLDVTSGAPCILRPGGITKDMLEGVLGHVDVAGSVLRPLQKGEKALSPGMRYKHYSPDGQVTLVEGAEADVVAAMAKLAAHADAQGHRACVMCFTEHMDALKDCHPHDIGSRDNASEVAHRLFDTLRRLDEEHMDVIFSEVVPPEGVGLAVMNRLGRAAAFHTIQARDVLKDEEA